MKRTIETWLAAILILLAATNAVKAQALSEQPPIPAGKVLTPGGHLVDAACAFEVPRGGIVSAAGDVTVNGKSVARHTPCTKEQMGSATSTGPQPPQVAQWMADTWAWSSAGAYGWMFSYWQVPPSTPTQNGALIYLFPSFESNTTDPNLAEIVQPVLQWGYNGQFGGNYWVIASWYVSSTQAPHSTPVGVTVGDQLYAYTSDGGGNLWDIFVEDRTTGAWADLYAWVRGPFDTVQGGVLEAYYVTNCAQFPHGLRGSSQFTDYVYQPAGSQGSLVFPTWWTQIGTLVNPSPNCNYGASGSNTTQYSLANLTY